MKLFRQADKRTVSSGLAIALSAVALYCLLNNLGSVSGFINRLYGYIKPVVGGAALAYLLRPFARFLERRVLKKIKSEKARVHIAGITVILLFVLAIIMLIATLLPEIIESIQTFSSNIGSYITMTKDFIREYAEKIDIAEIDINELIGSNQSLLDTAGTWLTDNIGILLDALYNIGSYLFQFIIIVAMALYALLDRKNIKKGLKRLQGVLIGDAKSARVNEILNRGDDLMVRFLGSNLIDALLIAAVNFLFLSIFKAQYAVLLSVMLGMFNFIPTFGPILGGIIAGAVVLLTNPSLLLGFAIFTLVLQQIDGNVIKPVLFGDSTGMSPFWVLVSIIVGGRAFGVAGMLLGVPVFALLSSIYSEIIEKRTQIKRSDAAMQPAAADAPPPESIESIESSEKKESPSPQPTRSNNKKRKKK